MIKMAVPKTAIVYLFANHDYASQQFTRLTHYVFPHFDRSYPPEVELIKSTVHSKIKIQSLSTHSHTDGRVDEVF